MEKKEKKKEEDLLISCTTSFQFFFFFFFLAKVSRRLEPLRFVSQEHSPMLLETAWYKSVVFCR